MKAAVRLPVTEPAALAELQRGHLFQAGPAFAQVKRRPGIS